MLTRYFGGEIGALDTIAVELNGTPFQKNVWQALRRIPGGTTISYAELAKRIGEPSAVRAVGTANGANPVAVIVPCHRVIGSNGRLTGYGGGLDRKQWLLAHEGVVSRRASSNAIGLSRRWPATCNVTVELRRKARWAFCRG